MTSYRPRGGGRPRTTTEAQWFDAGITVLDRDGRRGFTMTAVCDEMAARASVFYRRWSSWEDYTRALVRHWATERYAPMFADVFLDSTLSAAERFRRISKIAFELPPAGRLLRDLGWDDPELHELIQEGDEASVAVLAVLLADAWRERKGEKRDPDEIQRAAARRAWTLYSAFMGLVVFTPPKEIVLELDETIEDFLRP